MVVCLLIDMLASLIHQLIDSLKVLRHYGDSDVTAVDDGAMATSVEESEETLDDGTVVKKRVVTTTQQQLTTERVRLEHEDEDGDLSRQMGPDDEPAVFDYSHTGRCLV